MSLRGTRRLAKDGSLRIEMFIQNEMPWRNQQPEECYSCGRLSKSGRVRYRDGDRAWFCDKLECQRVGAYWQHEGKLPDPMESKKFTTSVHVPDQSKIPPWEPGGFDPEPEEYKHRRRR